MDHELAKFFDLDERREEVRLNIGAEIFLEKVAADPSEGTPAEVVRCEALDISANGMQVLVDAELVPGGIHTLIVEIYRNESTFKLTSEIKWVEPSKEGFLVGLALFDSEGTEIADWKLAMAKYLN